MSASKFDNKLLGIYLIIEAKHIFIGNEYFNDLCCIKVYNFDPQDDTYTLSLSSGPAADLHNELIGLVSNGQ